MGWRFMGEVEDPALDTVWSRQEVGQETVRIYDGTGEPNREVEAADLEVTPTSSWLWQGGRFVRCGCGRCFCGPCPSPREEKSTQPSGETRGDG